MKLGQDAWTGIGLILIAVAADWSNLPVVQSLLFFAGGILLLKGWKQ